MWEGVRGEREREREGMTEGWREREKERHKHASKTECWPTLALKKRIKLKTLEKVKTERNNPR